MYSQLSAASPLEEPNTQGSLTLGVGGGGLKWISCLGLEVADIEKKNIFETLLDVQVRQTCCSLSRP